MLGEQRELDPARGPDLVEDVRQVGLDRVLADGQLLADLLVGEPADNHPHNLELTRRQPEYSPAPKLRIEFAQAGGSIDHGAGGDPVLTG